jgi:hypothetical protein
VWLYLICLLNMVILNYDFGYATNLYSMQSL